MIRVGAGSARGRLLKTPRTERPTLGRIRQTLFDIIAGRVPDSHFLDVFAGSGAVGIEALSRGAKWAAFIEKNRPYAALIKENLECCGFADRSEIICAEAARGLGKLAARKTDFDLIFFDPPYQDMAALERALEVVGAEQQLLRPEGLIIVQRSRFAAPIKWPHIFSVTDSRVIGDSVLEFAKKESN